MISPVVMLCLFVAHYFADFVFQSDKMALNKSHSWKWLSLHCFVYGVCFLPWGWQVSLVLMGTHFVIDAVTSRLNAYFWKREERRYFFLTIGADQMLHLFLLVLVAPWVF